MKKLFLTLILAVMLAFNADAAVVSKSFTATGGGGVLSVKVGDSFTYSVSGTFVGTWVLQKSENGGNSWETVATGTGSGGATVLAESRGSNQLSYRMFCSAYTSGTIVTTMTDETGYITPVDEFKNKNGKTVAHTTENGFVVDGSFTGGTEDGSVVFNVKNELYGAKGDGITKFDGAITSGTDDFTSASASFTTADVGKVITITNGAGASSDLTTTISAFVSSTAVTLATNATNTVTGAIYTYGTDDTTAIRNAVAAVGNANPPVGIVYFPAGIYIINGEFDQTDGAQIAVPTKLSTSTPYFMTTVKFQGPIFTKSTNFYGFNAGGAILYSTRNGAAGNSVITGKGTGGASSFTDIRVDVEDLTIRTVQNPSNNALDLLFINTAIINNLYIEAGTVLLGDITAPTETTSHGLIMPGTQNNNVTFLTNVRIQGFYNGLNAGEHTSGHNVDIFYAVNGLVFSSSVHNAYFSDIGIERTINNIVCSATASFIIANVDMENAGASSGSWYQNVYDLKDTSSQCTGAILNYFIQGTEGGSATFTYDGAKKISFSSYSQNKYEFNTQSSSTFLAVVNKGTSSTSNGGIAQLVQDDGAATDAGHRLGSLAYGGATDTAGTRLFSASVSAFSDETYSSSATGGHLRLNTTPTGSNSPVERVRIAASGNVGIGTSNPTSLLQVGATNSSAFRVTSSANVGVGTTVPQSIIHANGATGTGQLTLDGDTGGCLMVRDTDNAGWSEGDLLDGVITWSIDADGICD